MPQISCTELGAAPRDITAYNQFQKPLHINVHRKRHCCDSICCNLDRFFYNTRSPGQVAEEAI